MNMVEIICKKRDKEKLTRQEIEYFIENYTNGSIPDYQAAALAMAILLNGMDEEEISQMTMAMARSGETLNLSDIGRQMIEKALERNNSNRKKAAAELGISDRTLYRRIKQYGLDKDKQDEE